MNLGGITDSLNIAQGKDLIKYAYSSPTALSEGEKEIGTNMAMKKIHRHQRPRHPRRRTLFIRTQFLFRLQYHAVVVGSSLA